MHAELHCAGTTLDMQRCHVMGVLNVTPDSFSDGGRFLEREQAVARARQMLQEGASIIDIGGESTRPGAEPVDVEGELTRVLPVIESLRAAIPEAVISVDTSKPEVMRAAVAAGAAIINDVRALTAPGALEAAADTDAAVCLMHMQGEPRTMQSHPHYDDVLAEVADFLAARRDACLDAGIGPQRLVLDPGFGFGKTLEHNLTLLRRLGELQALGPALLIGLSRKRMLGAILDAPVDQRLHGGLAAAVIGCIQGARIVRTHDVKPTVEALRVLDAVRLGFEAGSVNP